MSDTKLRELERRWKETGAVEDEAAYLLERVRVGDLARERLELAAYCGHEGAIAAVGAREAIPPREWMAGLVERAPGLLAPAALLAARAALDAWAQRGGEATIADDLLSTVEAHVESPTAESGGDIIRRIQDVTSNKPAAPSGDAAWAACVAASFAAAWGGSARAVNALIAAGQTLGSEERAQHAVARGLLRRIPL